MTCGQKTAVFVLVAFLAASGLYSYAPALLTSANYRILTNEQPSVGNAVPKTGGPYSLLGNTSQFGDVVLSGGRYAIAGGVINAVRPAQLDVSAAHVFPNPCNLRLGCNGIRFSFLTMNASIAIYTISGELVRKIEKTGDGDGIGWDLRNDAGAHVASGLYIYFIKADNSTKKGKMVIIR